MLAHNNETTTTGNLEPGDRALRDLAALGTRFVMFREEVRTRGDGKPVKTKVPYIPGTLSKASSTDPTTWRSYAAADAAMKTGRYDGIMVALGSVGRHFLAGFDVDTCLRDQRCA
jgi:primase-polymerase (primpol)-like protein